MNAFVHLKRYLRVGIDEEHAAICIQNVQNNKTGTFREEIDPFEYTIISGCILSQPSYDKTFSKAYWPDLGIGSTLEPRRPSSHCRSYS